MNTSHEIGLLQELLGLALRSARLGAALRDAEHDLYWRDLAEQMEDGDRELTIELARCLLWRGAEAETVHAEMKEPPIVQGPATEPWLLRGDLEAAALSLHARLGEVLRDPCTSQPIQELLGVHFLRLELRLSDLESVSDMPALPTRHAATRMPG